MTDTPRQQRNAARIRRALAGKRLFYRPPGRDWLSVGPLAFYVNRKLIRSGVLGEGAACMMVDQGRQRPKGSK